MPTALAVLKNANKFLSDETKWTKGSYFVYPEGMDETRSPAHAIRCCLAGAVLREGVTTSVKAIRALSHLLPGHTSDSLSTIISWNDNPHRTFDDVKVLLARAILIEESRT